MVKQFVWPRDQPHKKRTFGNGLWDILTGKGPDMYVADWRTPKIDWTEWGRWPQYGQRGSTGYFHYDDDWRTPSWIRSRRGYKSYDPKKRRYRTFYPRPEFGVWPPSYGPSPHPQGHDGPGGGFEPFGQQQHQHGDDDGWRLARRRRQSMPRSREEMMSDWRPVYVPYVAAAGGLNPNKFMWGPELGSPGTQSPWQSTATTTSSSLSSDSEFFDDLLSDFS